jgi:hypothetical protein
MNEMKTINLSDEELEAFRNMYEDNELWEYLSYYENGKLAKDAYSMLFSKLGIDLTEQNNLDFGDKNV